MNHSQSEQALSDMLSLGDPEIAAGPAPPVGHVTLSEAFRVWSKVGLLSFGGPAGQIALMHRIVVDEKRWISESRFLHALNFCMILPGPEAQQLATYIGWLLHGLRGGLLAGSLFIAPGFAVILGLSYLYVTAGQVPLVLGLFVGLKAAVIAIVFQALVRLGKRSLKTRGLVALSMAAFVSMFVFGVPFPYVVLSALAVGCFVHVGSGPTSEGGEESTEAVDGFGNMPHESGQGTLRYSFKIFFLFGLGWLLPIALLVMLLGYDHVYTSIATFFSKMAVVTFGGAYAVLAYVAQEAVDVQGWLMPAEMIDGLALAETTPGPLILVVQFVGFVAAYRNPGGLPPELAGLLGSLLTLWVTFLPCFLWIFLGAPHMERLRRNKRLTRAFSAVSAAVVGVIANLALWFAIHALFTDVSRVNLGSLSLEVPVLSSLHGTVTAITIAALIMTFRLRASVLTTLGVAGVLGMGSLMFRG